MTVKPTVDLDIAEDTNYTSGPHAGTATKVAFDSQDVDEGNIAGPTFAPDARKFNWWQHYAGKWVHWFEEMIETRVLFFSYSTSTDTASDPGSGNFRLNNASFASVTAITFDDATALTVDVSALLLAAGSGKITIAKDGGNYATWTYSGAADGAGTSVTFTITGLVDAAGSFSASDRCVVYLDETSSVALASTTETITGTDTAKAVTPNALAALWEKGANITDGATINLGEGGVFDLNTSTTTITAFAFTTSKAGRIAWVKFNTVRTLTHNATSLILPGSANITTAVGDYAAVLDLGSPNVQLFYFRADGTAVVCCDGEASTSHEIPLSFVDEAFYGHNLTGSFPLTFLPDNCVVMARATFAWGVTTGDTDDILGDGTAVLYLRLSINAGALVLVGFHNDSENKAITQFHAMSNIDFDNTGLPQLDGMLSATIDSGNLALEVYFPGTGGYAGETLDGIAHLHIESIFERSELPAP